jgi:hypothetical protein
MTMKKFFITSAILTVLSITGCTSAPAPPLDVGDKLIIPADHTFVVPPQGIRFSNGATIGVRPE